MRRMLVLISAKHPAECIPPYYSEPYYLTLTSVGVESNRPFDSDTCCHIESDLLHMKASLNA